MNDNENNKSNEELADEALDAVSGGRGNPVGMVQGWVGDIFDKVCDNCGKDKPLKRYFVAGENKAYCDNCAGNLGLLS